MTTSTLPPHVNRGVLLVGDPRRKLIGRAVVGMLLTAAAFVAFAWITKQVVWLSAHSPWAEDPYDAVVSFTFFFVPLVAGLCLVRLPLCRSDKPQSVERMVDLLRGSRVAIAAVLVTLVADWASVLLRSNQASWSASTGILVGLLALLTTVTVAATVVLRRALTQPLPAADRGAASADWFADIVAIADQACRHIGPLGPLGRRAVGWTDHHAVAVIRRRPLAAAAAAALGFGAMIAASMSFEEGVAPVLGLFFVVGAAGMFAFLVVAGSYLGLVRGAPPSVGVRRRLIDAAVVSCASVPVALAFRTWLWWVVGSTEASAGLGALASLLTIVAVGTFVLILVAESIAGRHAPENG